MWIWLKRYMPKGLYGRVIAILLLPVLSVQAIVGVAYVQRYYDTVTRQMTLSLLPVLEAVIDGAPAQPLGITRGTETVTDQITAFDLSGRALRRVLDERLPEMTALDLSDPHRVTLGLDTAQGLQSLSFARARVTAQNPHQLLVLMAVIGVVMTWIAYLYLRGQMRPIRRLGRVAEAYGRGRVEPLPLSGATEVRAAGAAFLEMRARLERQTAARRMMLTGISHDLRTPLTRMRLELSLMDPETAAPMLSDVQEMETLVAAFLDYARDSAEDRAERTAPAAILRDAIAAASRLGAVELGDLPDDLPDVMMQPMGVRRALDNLLSNALRHGRHVRAGITRGPRSVRFVVEDDGPGIPADRRAEATRAFIRLDPARGREGGAGMGLGLAIVTDVARGHGGRLDLEQSDLGGLRAVLTLPV